MVTTILVLLYRSASSAALFLLLWSHQAWMIPVSHDPVSRNRYANRKVIKKSIKKSERIYPMIIRNPKAKNFSKNIPENTRGISLRNMIRES